jgi:hypothetical protein
MRMEMEQKKREEQLAEAKRLDAERMQAERERQEKTRLEQERKEFEKAKVCLCAFERAPSVEHLPWRCAFFSLLSLVSRTGCLPGPVLTLVVILKTAANISPLNTSYANLCPCECKALLV